MTAQPVCLQVDLLFSEIGFAFILSFRFWRYSMNQIRLSIDRIANSLES